MTRAPLTDAERGAVLSDLRAGLSQYATARKHRRHPATVSRLARAAGLDAQRCATKKATDARRDYTAAARLALVNALFDKVCELLPSANTPAALHSLVMSAAVLIDKRRLEDGDVTARLDVHDSGARERIARRVDELARRRVELESRPGGEGP